MRKRLLWLALVCMCAACSPQSDSLQGREPTRTPTPVVDPGPALTSTRAPFPTQLPAVTNTPRPGGPAGGIVARITGIPKGEWHGVPVMPGALAGEGDELGYRFTIQESRQGVMKYYDQHMAELSWIVITEGQGKNGNLLMIYKRGQQTFSIAVITLQDGLLQVMLVD